VAHGRGRWTRLYWAAAALLVLGAAALWLARANSSSLFTDEALSWLEAKNGLHTLLAVVRREEINPLAYPLLLHEWLKLAPSSSEFWLRVPSVICGALVVAAVIWLAALVAGRKASLLAGALALVSPFMFDYAQQVRAYVFAMLAVAVAVAALLEAERRDRRQGWWVGLSVVAAALAVAIHYTAWLILGPLWIYLLASRLPRSAKLSWTVVAAAASVPWAPLLLHQMRGGHNVWLTWFANLTAANVGDVFSGPFAGRVSQPSGRGLLGSAIVLAAALICLMVRRRQVRLLVVLAMVSPVALLASTLVGQPALLIRYDAVSVPFMIVMLAIALMTLPAWSRIAIVGVLVLSLWNVRQADKATSQYQNYRGAFTYIKAHYRPGDLVAVIGNHLVSFNLDYYVPRMLPHAGVTELPPIPARILLNTPPVVAAEQARRTIWFLNANLPAPAPHPKGYSMTAKRVFIDIGVLEVDRFQPSTHGPPLGGTQHRKRG
jgi:4-amino-4-deoxy-L-arabinose transferase-like glycosyltransferase